MKGTYCPICKSLCYPDEEEAMIRPDEAQSFFRIAKALEVIANKMPKPPEPKKEWEKEINPDSRHHAQVAAWKRIQSAIDIIDNQTGDLESLSAHAAGVLLEIRKVLTGNN